MTLAEMSDYICGKVNQTETEDVAFCKKFIRRRYELIFTDQLWKDSIGSVDVALDPDNSDNAAGIVVLPELIDRPIAVRGANRAVLVNPLERYYRIDLDMFLRTGTQYEMALLSPAWLTVRPSSDPFDRTVVKASGSTYSATTVLVAGLPTLKSGFSSAVTAGLWYQLVGDTNIVGYIQSVAGVLDFANLVSLTAGQTVNFLATDTFVAVLFSTSVLGNKTFGGSFDQIVLAHNKSSGAGATITITSSAVGADTSNLKVIWRDLAGKRYETISALPSITLTPDDDAGYFEIEAVFKATTDGTITLTLNDSSGLTLVLGTIAPSATRSPSYQRIRVFDIPSASATLKVAGKVKCDTLDFDSGEPLLRGVENILLPMAQGDMLERERHYGQAQALFQEAAVLLEQYKRVEVVQQAYNKRIIPQEGYASGYDFYADNLLTF